MVNMKNSKEKLKRSKMSAGLLMFRIRGGKLQLFLVHPGGPFWVKKDVGAWSVPKGEVRKDDSLLETAVREFEEEVGFKPEAEFIDLGEVKQAGGKTVHAWAFESDIDEKIPIMSNTFRMEFPPHSGLIREFPEIDKAGFFDAETAKEKINPAQAEFIERLRSALKSARIRGRKIK